MSLMMKDSLGDKVLSVFYFSFLLLRSPELLNLLGIFSEGDMVLDCHAGCSRLF